MEKTPRDGSNPAAPGLLMESLRGKHTKGKIAAWCKQVADEAGLQEFSRLLPSLLVHAAQGDAAPEMQYVQHGRMSLTHLAQSLKITKRTLAQRVEEIRKRFDERVTAVLRAHPERNGNGEVQSLVQTFADRYRECAALAGICERELIEMIENELVKMLMEPSEDEKNAGDDGQEETERQKAVRESAQAANRKSAGTLARATMAPQANGEGNTLPLTTPTRIGDSGELTPVPRAQAFVQPEGVIDFQEVTPEGSSSKA